MTTTQQELEEKIKELKHALFREKLLDSLIDDLIASRERLKAENEKMVQVFKDELCSMAIKLLAVKEWAEGKSSHEYCGEDRYGLDKSRKDVLEIINKPEGENK